MHAFVPRRCLWARHESAQHQFRKERTRRRQAPRVPLHSMRQEDSGVNALLTREDVDLALAAMNACMRGLKGDGFTNVEGMCLLQTGAAVVAKDMKTGRLVEISIRPMTKVEE